MNRTQKQTVLMELKRCTRKGITSWDMIEKHHITRTAAHVCTLKKEGYKIDAVDETRNGVCYARYFLREGTR